MKLTDQHRSMIASAFVAAYDYADRVQAGQWSLCCAQDALNACARIVGKRNAEKLWTFFYDSLGCGGWKDPEYNAEQEQYFLDKISALEEL